MSENTDAAQAAESTVSDDIVSDESFSDGLESSFVDDTSPTPRESGEISDEAPTQAGPTSEPASSETAETVTPDTDETPTAEPAEKQDPPAEDSHVPLAALHQERERRRELAEQNAQLLKLLQPQQQEQTPADPLASLDFIDDPQGSANALQQYVNTQLEQQRTELTHGFKQSLTGLMESQVAATHEDYPQARAVFDDAMTRNPVLKAQFDSAPNPAQFAYETGKNMALIQQHGGTTDLAALLAKARAEGEAAGRNALQSEIQQTTQVPANAAAATATSLNSLAASQSSIALGADSDNLAEGLTDHFV